jgi:sugar lactone lactonase YvrE
MRWTALFLLVLFIACSTTEAKYGGGSGTSSDPYLIKDINHIIQLGNSPGHWDKYFKFTADIDMAHDTEHRFGMIGRNVLLSPRNIKIDSDEGKVYWSDDDYSCIYRTDIEGGNIETVIGKEVALPIGIDLDLKARKIYWSDFRNHRIQRADLNGENIETVVSTDVNYPYGIALDTTSGRVYWVEPYDNQIRSVNFDGTNLKIINEVPYAWGIAIDDVNGHIYWSEHGSDKIARSNLDGGEYEVILSDIRAPLGIALDLAEGKIYWAQYGGVYRANIDGSNPIKLAGGSQQYEYEYGIGLEFPGPIVYWTSHSSRLIYKLNYGQDNIFIKNWSEGQFNGNNHKISNLNLTITDGTPLIGFFSQMGPQGECENIILVDPNINALNSYCVGALAGSSNSIINCSVLGGTVRGDRNVGGLAGRTYGTIKGCHTSVNVDGNQCVGALVGTIDGIGTGTIERCFSQGNVTGSTKTGGIIGESGGTILNCCSDANIYGKDFAGGIAGYNFGSIDKSYSRGEVIGDTNAGGLLGYNEYMEYFNITVTNSFWDTEASGQTTSAGGLGAAGKTTAEMQMQSTFINAGWNFKTWHFCDGYDYPIPYAFGKYSDGWGDTNSPYQIANVDDLINLANDVNDYNKCFIMNTDIDLDPNLPGNGVFTTAVIAPDIHNANSEFDGVPFTGVFDGDGHNIVNLTINTNGFSNDYLGLFGNINGGEAKNLRLKYVTVTGENAGWLNYSEHIGGLAGYNGGAITDCCSISNVSIGISIGGLAGSNTGSISKCCSTGAVYDGRELGGLVGSNFGNISNCYSTGNVTGLTGSSTLGGLAGINSGGHIINCYSTANVSGTSSLGGLTGDNNGTISSCYFLNTSSPKNGYGIPLTSSQLKQKSSFFGWDFVGETKNGSDDIWMIFKSRSCPILWWEKILQINKCSVTAGKKEDTDKIAFSGLMTATAEDFNIAAGSSNDNFIWITISCEGMNCVLTVPVNSETWKKGKFSYSGTEYDIKKSFKYNAGTGDFSFAASNLGLSSLICPIMVDITIGGFSANTENDESVVNGAKPIPIKFLMDERNSFRVDKSKFTRDKITNNITRFTISGGFSVADISNANMADNDFTVQLAGQTFTIPAHNFKANKKGDKYTCSKADISNGIVYAKFDFNKCTFTLTIKNTKISYAPGNAEFGIEFARFNYTKQIEIQ